MNQESPFVYKHGSPYCMKRPYKVGDRVAHGHLMGTIVSAQRIAPHRGLKKNWHWYVKWDTKEKPDPIPSSN